MEREQRELTLRVAELEVEVSELQEIESKLEAEIRAIKKAHEEGTRRELAELKASIVETAEAKAEAIAIDFKIEEMKAYNEKMAREWNQKLVDAMKRDREFRKSLETYDPLWAMSDLTEIANRFTSAYNELVAENERLEGEVKRLSKSAEVDAGGAE